MPHFKFTSDPVHLEALRQEVAKRFGRPISTNTDCSELARAMNAASGSSLSRTLLRRFFLNRERSFFRNTLDKLAAYAAGCDFLYFCRLLAAGSAADAPTQVVEPIMLLGPTYALSLQQGYVLGMRTRPGSPAEAAEAQALAQAANPAGQKLFVESFVDLAHVTGAYGTVVEKYLDHAAGWDKQIFGYSVLFLSAFLAEDKPLWQRRLGQLRAVPVPHGLHPFPMGRRAFALLMADWAQRPAKPLSASALEALRQEARTCAVAEADAGYPMFYNYFPAGYHFMVAEALFLSGRFASLTQWLATTDELLGRVAYQSKNNVFREVLEAFRAVAYLYNGAPAEAMPYYQALKPSVTVADNRWLWDYYQVYLWLTDLHFAAKSDGLSPNLTAAHHRIELFAQERNMPFFRNVACRIVNSLIPQ